MGNALHRSQRQACGFTLIEVLVAMAMLLIIVMIVAQVFQQARVAWDTGKRRVDVNMKGRALADFMAQEMAKAVRNSTYPEFGASGKTAKFWMLGDATKTDTAVQKVSYSFNGTTVSRNGEEMCDRIEDVDFVEEYGEFDASTELPLFVNVTVKVSDGLSTNAFQSRACMIHRQRYSMD